MRRRTINLYVKQKSGDLFAPRNYDPDIEGFARPLLRAEDAETIVPATADFSFLDLIRRQHRQPAMPPKPLGKRLEAVRNRPPK